jgi:hypothetical protein
MNGSLKFLSGSKKQEKMGLGIDNYYAIIYKLESTLNLGV